MSTTDNTARPEALIERARALLEEAGVVDETEHLEGEVSELREAVEELDDDTADLGGFLVEEVAALRAEGEAHLDELSILLSEVIAAITDLSPERGAVLTERIRGRPTPHVAVSEAEG
jgi:predicted  nucleic acid-binding Zn-ribbon protein